MQFVKDGFVKKGFVKGSEDTSIVAEIDYDKIFRYIDDSVAFLKSTLSDEILNNKIDLNPVIKSVASLKSDIKIIDGKVVTLQTNLDNNYQNLDEKISNLSNQISVGVFSSFPSLNGAYGSFLDGDILQSELIPGKLTVISSFLILNEMDKYIVCYRLENENKNVIILPSVFLTEFKEKNENVGG